MSDPIVKGITDKLYGPDEPTELDRLLAENERLRAALTAVEALAGSPETRGWAWNQVGDDWFVTIEADELRAAIAQAQAGAEEV